MTPFQKIVLRAIYFLLLAADVKLGSPTYSRKVRLLALDIEKALGEDIGRPI